VRRLSASPPRDSRYLGTIAVLAQDEEPESEAVWGGRLTRASSFPAKQRTSSLRCARGRGRGPAWARRRPAREGWSLGAFYPTGMGFWDWLCAGHATEIESKVGLIAALCPALRPMKRPPFRRPCHYQARGTKIERPFPQERCGPDRRPVSPDTPPATIGAARIPHEPDVPKLRRLFRVPILAKHTYFAGRCNFATAGTDRETIQTQRERCSSAPVRLSCSFLPIRCGSGSVA
jgi:hypothetical protein